MKSLWREQVPVLAGREKCGNGVCRGNHREILVVGGGYDRIRADREDDGENYKPAWSEIQ